jgi:hypothetical protein
MASCCPSVADPHRPEPRNLDAIGPSMMPISTAGTGVVSARLYSNVVTPRT